jgi:hypothetical protein
VGGTQKTYKINEYRIDGTKDLLGAQQKDTSQKILMGDCMDFEEENPFISQQTG